MERILTMEKVIAIDMCPGMRCTYTKEQKQRLQTMSEGFGRKFAAGLAASLRFNLAEKPTSWASEQWIATDEGTDPLLCTSGVLSGGNLQSTKDTGRETADHHQKS